MVTADRAAGRVDGTVRGGVGGPKIGLRKSAEVVPGHSLCCNRKRRSFGEIGSSRGAALLPARTDPGPTPLGPAERSRNRPPSLCGQAALEITGQVGAAASDRRE